MPPLQPFNVAADTIGGSSNRTGGFNPRPFGAGEALEVHQCAF